MAIGTPFHTWQIVAQGKQPAAHKAMVQAAKAMAATGAAALLDPTLMAAAKADLAARTAKTPYVSPIPERCRAAIAHVAWLKTLQSRRRAGAILAQCKAIVPTDRSHKMAVGFAAEELSPCRS